MSGPLAGIRVLDLTRQLAGPWSAQMLGDLGADVVKVERPNVGDEVRSFGPPFIRNPDGSESKEAPFFFAGNRNKRSVTVNLSRPQGQDLIRKMVPHFDIFIENYKVGTMDRYGLGYETIRQHNPGMIYCSITGFGQTGPYKDRPGYDSIFQAMCGLMSINGYPNDEPGGGPMRVGIATADIMTGMYSSIAMLGALHHREKTGEGQHIDMALFDVQIATLTVENMRHLLLGEIPERTGNVSRNLVPSQAFTCSDGQLSITIGNDDQFKRLSHCLGNPQWAQEDKFRTGSARRKNRSELVAQIEKIFLCRTVKEWVDDLAQANVPVGAINNIAQTFNDPNTIARKLKVSTQHPTLGEVPLVANPIRYSSTKIEYHRAPPLLGQHTEEILAEFAGTSTSQIRKLREDGVI